MRSTLNISNTLVNILFIGSMMYLVIILNALPEVVYNHLHASNVIIYIYFILAIGCVGIIISYMLLNSFFAKEVVYVDRIIVDKLNGESNIEFDESITRNMEQCEKSLDKVLANNQSKEDKFDCILSILCSSLNAGQGIAYKIEDNGGSPILKQFSTYAYAKDSKENNEIELGEGLAGLAAKENKIISLDNIPNNYLSVFSGLGKTSKVHLLILPLRANERVVGIVELALMWSPKEEENKFFNKLSLKLGLALSNN